MCRVVHTLKTVARALAGRADTQWVRARMTKHLATPYATLPVTLLQCPTRLVTLRRYRLVFAV